MARIAAVTICSINYLSKALVLCESYLQFHSGHSFYIVIVDRKKADLRIDRPGLSILWVEDLAIKGFLQYAFAYDVIELNTNVKATVLEKLLGEFDAAVYLDPDIQVFARLDCVFGALDSASIVLTPHSNTPILDGKKPDDLDFLRFGAFNLGFIAVARSDEAFSFLKWWSARCLEYGFYEPQLGLAVDQKWANLAPCYFPTVKILHDIGLNVAFWNLHERHLSWDGTRWIVNESQSLKFIHFSSFNSAMPGAVAQKQNRFAEGSRPDFEVVAREYAKLLIEADSKQFSKSKYGFDYFDDGAYIPPALRRFYAGLRKSGHFDLENPFDPKGTVRTFARRNGLLSRGNSEMARQNFPNIDAYRLEIAILLRMFRLALFVLGPNKYFALMRYLAHMSSLRNQAAMFGKIE